MTIEIMVTLTLIDGETLADIRSPSPRSFMSLGEAAQVAAALRAQPYDARRVVLASNIDKAIAAAEAITGDRSA